MTIENANDHPFKVAIVKDAEIFANSHPFKVYIEGGGGGGAEARVVDELPAEGESGYIYLVLKEETAQGDIYDEWIWALQQDGETYDWEHLGVTNEVTLEIDDAMSSTSENAVQNKVIKQYVDESTGKARELTTADYNWPTSNPNGVAMWLLPEGVYSCDATTNVYPDNGASAVNQPLFFKFNSSVYSFMVYYYESDNSWKYWKTLTATGARNSFGRVTPEVVDSLTSTSTTSALSANQGKALKDLVDSLAVRGAGAPTTSTVGQVGTLYEDTNNGDLYICTDATNPYVWEEVGAGGGGGGSITELTTADYNYPTDNPTSVALWLLEPGLYTVLDSSVVVKDSSQSTVIQTGEVFLVSHSSGGTVQIYKFNFQNALIETNLDSSGNVTATATYLTTSSISQTTGTSTSNVMSQKAVTDTLFSNNDKYKIQIGANASASGANASAIGAGAVAGGGQSIAFVGGSTSTAGVMQIGTNRSGWEGTGYASSDYRLLTGLYDGQSAHDAVNLGQLNGRVKQNAGAPTTATVGTVGQLLEDTTNGKLYICTDATNPYVWEEVGAGGGGGIINGGTTAPTTSTVGTVGSLYSYVDTTDNILTPHLLMCVIADTVTPSYTWVELVTPLTNNQLNTLWEAA